MGQGIPSDAPLVVPPPPAPGQSQDFVVYLTHVPWDDYFQLKMFRKGREVTEELDVEETRKFFKERFTKAASREQELAREEALERALDECWNFSQTKITIPAGVYNEPALPFPQFQPKV